MQSDDNIETNYNNSAEEKYSFNKNRITALDQILHIQNIPESKDISARD